MEINEIKNQIELKIKKYFGISPEEANIEQMYKAVVMTVKDVLTQKRIPFREDYKKQKSKRVYYICMEFLVGRLLKNNLMNLNLHEEYGKTLNEFGFDIADIYECEPDPGLGNGGLGRLAACFLDSLTSRDYNAVGYSICYEFGIFKQKIIDGMQVELPDVWMPKSDAWLLPRTEKPYIVRFGGAVKEAWRNGKLDIIHENYDSVGAVPYDLMISGADCKAVNVLRLWRAVSTSDFDMVLFSQGRYIKAMEENTNAEIISKVLYPPDNHEAGKLLRLTQQYFLVSASLQEIINNHLDRYGTMENFHEKNAIHLNDTHPALCIPEFMRILLDVYSYSWENAWFETTNTFSYTNHTILPEALEQWNEALFKMKLPRIYSIIQEINKRLCADLWTLYPGDWSRISRMAITADSNIRMANLCVAGSYKVNGVSKLHTEILKNTIFHDFYKMAPHKFINITNGIAHRRWLCYCNQELAELLDGAVAQDYRGEPASLSKFLNYQNDGSVLSKLQAIKQANKEKFAKHVKKVMNVTIDTNSIFDVQIKRIHEYKRQLLNALRIISLYADLTDDPDMNIYPQTFIFAGKAASGYYLAKEIIKLIYFIGQDIEKNQKIREKLRVLFMEDYNVSLAEILIPAADISEQISLAGKEASGTSNMKFMINGALTIGTLDGANVEIHDAVGGDNIFIFGLNAAEVEELWKRGYNSSVYYHSNERIKRAVDHLNTGFGGISFTDISQYLLTNYIADPYMCLADFDSYFSAHEKMNETYLNKTKWYNMSLINIASAGCFSADRSIEEYANNIWHLNKIK